MLFFIILFASSSPIKTYVVGFILNIELRNYNLNFLEDLPVDSPAPDPEGEDIRVVAVRKVVDGSLPGHSNT